MGLLTDFAQSVEVAQATLFVWTLGSNSANFGWRSARVRSQSNQMKIQGTWQSFLAKGKIAGNHSKVKKHNMGRTCSYRHILQ
jgi:hypothetical protein